MGQKDGLRVQKKRKILVSLIAALFLAGSVSGTELKNIEKITPQGSQNINITGTIDMKGNSITDTSGVLTLDGGKVEVPEGNLNTRKINIENGNNIDLYSGGSIQWSIQDDTSNNELGFYDGNQDVLQLRENNNVRIPNGNLAVSGNTDGVDLDNPGTAITVNSNQYEVADNSISVTELDTGSTDTRYLNRGGDAMNGDLNLNNYDIKKVSNLDVSTSSEQIASFSSTGIDFKQPLSLESSGPLSVANGVQLTGTSSNTLESYSTLYLETSSGSPSDIVLNPTGQVGVDSNLSIAGNIDMDSPGSIKTDGTDGIIVDSSQNVEITNGNLNLNKNDLNLGNSADVTAPNSGSLRVRATGGGNNVLFDVRDTGAGQNDFLVREGGNVEIPNGNVGIGQSAGNNRLEVNGAIEASSVKNVQQVEIQSGGTPRLRFTDTDSSTAMDMDIEVQNNRLSVQNQSDSTELLNVRADSGNVKVANGNLDVNGNIEGSNKLTLTGGGAGEDAVLYTANDGSFYIENYQNGGLENAKLGLVDNNNNNVYLQARGGTIGPKNANLRLNSGYSIENGGGTEAITLDSNANVKLPNGNLNMNGNSISFDTDSGASPSLRSDYTGDAGTSIGAGGLGVEVRTDNTANIKEISAVFPRRTGFEVYHEGDKELDVKENVEIPNGNLDMKSNNINNIGTSNVDMVHDSSDDRVEMRSNGKEDICIGNCGT